MPKAIDLTGKQFGNWTVLYRAENSGREVMWHCHCSCGNERDVNAKSLKGGKSTSCGCEKTNMEDVVGKKFGKLLVVSQDGNVCHCVCDCGNKIDYTVRELLNGRNKSCGCLQHKDEDLTGQRFEKLVAIEKGYDKNNDIGYLCKCDCGDEKFVLAYKLRNNIIKSCGCAKHDFSGEDLTGRQFGKWKVVSFSHKSTNDVYYWNCICECGTERKVSSKLLKRGLSKSCGCEKLGTNLKLAGTKIGKWTILKNIDTLRWLCRCDCGVEKIVYYSNIMRGLSYSCGCTDIAHSGSKAENEIKDYILSLVPKIIVEKSRTVLDGKEIDIFLPEYNIGIEYNGSLYHASINGLYGDKPKDYHFDKFVKAKEKDIRLLTIFDVDWENNKEKIKYIIRDLLIPCKKIYGRLCEIKEMGKDEAKEFLDKYHLQGANKRFMKIDYGLYYENELVSVMSFDNARFGNETGYELYRYCVKPKVTIIGGANKLFKKFIDTHEFDKIICYSDNDYFNGNVYKSLGFQFDGYTTLSYYWYVNGKEIKREKCQPKRLKKQYPDLYEKAIGSKENYIMIELGARKVYRCGNTRWIYRKEE